MDDQQMTQSEESDFPRGSSDWWFLLWMLFVGVMIVGWITLAMVDSAI